LNIEQFPFRLQKTRVISCAYYVHFPSLIFMLNYLLF